MRARRLLVVLLAFLPSAHLAHAVRPNLGTSDDGSNKSSCYGSTPNLVVLPSASNTDPYNTCGSNGQGGGRPITISGSNPAFTVTLTPALYSGNGGFSSIYTLFDVTLTSSDPGLRLTSILLGAIPTMGPGSSATQPVNYLACSQATAPPNPTYYTLYAATQTFCMGPNNTNVLEIATAGNGLYAYDPAVIINGAANTVKWDTNCVPSAANVPTECAVLAVGGFPDDVNNVICTSAGNCSNATQDVEDGNGLYLGNLPVTVVATTSAGTIVTATVNSGPTPQAAPAATNTLPANATSITSPSFSTAVDVTAALPQQNPTTGTMASTPAVPLAFTVPGNPSPITCSGNPLDTTTINSLYANYFRAAWYKLTTTAGGTVIADTKGSSYDTRVIVLSGDPINNPAGVTAVACDDDLPLAKSAAFDPRQLQGAVNFTAAANSTYYIMVSEAPGVAGNSVNAGTLAAATPLSSDPILALSVTSSPFIANPSTLQFAAQAISTTSSAQQITLTVDAAVSGFIYSASPGFLVSTPDCTATMGAGQICHLNVSFDPTSAAATNGNLQISATGASGLTVPLSGAISPTTTFTLSPSSGLTFLDQNLNTSSAPMTAVVTNTGSAPLSISSISFSGATADFSQPNNCTAGLIPTSSQCAIQVTFTPQAGGNREAILTVTGNATASQRMSLSGTGVGPAAAPTFSVPSGTYNAVNVAISDTTTGATIFYTTDGTLPTPSSAQYSGPIAINSTKTIKAIATASGYNTSALASVAYTIASVPVVGEWAWMAGGSKLAAKGVYGSLGTAAPGNAPGDRNGVVTWTDISGNLWLFGGLGYDSVGNYGALNDLWEFFTATREWAWMGGSSTVPTTCKTADTYGNCGQPGNYGTLSGTGGFGPAPGIVPGARYNAVSWSDRSGNLWLFGGYGFDSSAAPGELGDLWEYIPSLKEWAWVSGNSCNCGLPGVYGTFQVPAGANFPAGRDSAVSWADSSGNLWLFGGFGTVANIVGGTTYISTAQLNDLWEFSPASHQWAWMAGSSSFAASGTYGTLGHPANGNSPGARDRAASWTDSSGNFWLFGGYGFDSTHAFADLNDLWQFNPSTLSWTWIAGSNIASMAQVVYGTPGVSAASNIPGTRFKATSWTDRNGNLWLFGGYGGDTANSFGLLNDLWEFSPVSNQWHLGGGKQRRGRQCSLWLTRSSSRR